MTDWLFAPPIWLVLVIVIAGIAVFIYANARTSTQGRLGGVAIAIAGVLLFVVGRFVDTPLEACVKRTYAIIAAVEAADWTKMESLLNNNTSVMNFRGAKEIADGARKRADQFGLKRAFVLGRDQVQRQNVIDVVVSVLSEQNMPPQIRTTWRFKYEVRSDGILLSEIAPESTGELSADQMRQRLGK